MEAVLSAAGDFALVVSDSSHVASARASAQRLARALDFDETRGGRIGIVVTEAVTNMLKHAGGGTFVARTVVCGGVLGIEMLAIDSGRGMSDVRHSEQDGVSTTGTAGNGLGAMRRLCDEMELHSEPGVGTIVRTLSWAAQAPGALTTHQVGAVCIPKPGETVCGDAWDVAYRDDGITLLVADGLGHGPDAARAAAMAVEVLRRHPAEPALRLLDVAHARLKPTRGAAVAVARHDWGAGEVSFAGVGNIAAVVIERGARRAMVSHSGIVGHNVHKSQEYRYPWMQGGMLVAHSDGLESQWELDELPGIASYHPSIIAAALYRRHSRKRDDCTVVVAKALGRERA
jgi:anti-sigma regulatory factor (Ser/Thr protein kinase)